MRVISYGGGVQSTALVVLAAQGRIDFPVALFSNVGDDSEKPQTISYVRDVVIPWAADRGVDVLELGRVRRDGTPETLWGRLMKDGSRSIPIPVRMSDTGAPGTRSCTADFKIRVIARWLREHGATDTDPATVAIGFSTDEFHRASRKRADPAEVPAYPLLDLGLSRGDCAQIIRDAGLPVPPKSACFFCPFHDRRAWADMRRDEPDLFARSVHLERVLNERRDGLECPRVGAPASELRETGRCAVHGAECDLWNLDGYEDPDEAECEPEVVVIPIEPGAEVRCCGWTLIVTPEGTIPPHGKDRVYLTRYGKPLDIAIDEAQPTLFGADGPEECDEGYCWT